MKTQTFRIGGMYCAACSGAVERVVSRLNGVARCEVNLITEKMTATFDENSVAFADLRRVVEKAGFTIEEISAPGLPDPATGDSTHSDATVAPQNSVADGSFRGESFATAEGAAPNDDLRATGENGFPKERETGERRILARKGRKKTKRNRVTATKAELAVCGVLSLFILYVSMGQMLIPGLPVPAFCDIKRSPLGYAITQIALSLPVALIGRRFFTVGYGSLFRGHPNMDTLVAVGATASFLYSFAMTLRIPADPHAAHGLYYESVAVVITLVLLGKYLEARSKQKTTSAIQALVALTPDISHRLTDGRVEDVPTASVAVGDVLLVRPGEKIPLDAETIEGESAVDESMLTGESMPVFKCAGDVLTGGSINQSGVLTAKVLRVGKDTTLSKIIAFVEEAQGKKAPISKVADRVSGVFVPVVMSIAVLAAAIWWMVKPNDFSFAVRIFTSVLVIACPCALGLATPTAIMVGTGLGAAHGILIRNGEALEITHKTAVAVFDKTGTLTRGTPVVTDLIGEETLALAAAAENGATHPIASAVLQKAAEKSATYALPSASETVLGKGVIATVNGDRVLVGKRSFLEEQGVSTHAYAAQAEALYDQGKNVAFVAKNGRTVGLFAVADELKPTAVKTFSRLREMNVRTVILSGDSKKCAEAVGKTLGADEVFYEVLPEEKVQVISALKSKYGTTLMVGDGINDAPALSAADVGCAVASGTDIAIESADVVFMKSDPEDVARAVNLSRKTIRNVKQNLFWAFCYNAVCIPVAAGALFPFTGLLLSPMLAGLAMSLSSVCVVSNALRLRRKKI